MLPDTRLTNLSLLTCALLATGALVGCGGGGNGNDGSVTSGAPVNAVTSSVFAEPSGPLCAVKQDGICIEPTSSAISPEQLRAALRDPGGPEVRLTRFGHIINVYSKVRFTTETGSKLIESSFGYDSAEKSMIFGRNQIKTDGKTFVFSKSLDDGGTEYQAGETDSIKVGPPELDPLVNYLEQLGGTANMTGTPPTDVTFTNDIDVWRSYFGVLTDRADVNVPQNNLIQYSGKIYFKGGDGTPLDRAHLNATDAICPIAFTLDVASGKLTSSGGSCSDGGTALNFSLNDLYIKSSRVSTRFGDEATASVSGPAQFHAGSDEERENPPSVTVPFFKSNKISGAIYGSNAAILVMHGSSPVGIFMITAKRQ